MIPLECRVELGVSKLFSECHCFASSHRLTCASAEEREMVTVSSLVLGGGLSVNAVSLKQALR